MVPAEARGSGRDPAAATRRVRDVREDRTARGAAQDGRDRDVHRVDRRGPAGATGRGRVVGHRDAIDSTNRGPPVGHRDEADATDHGQEAARQDGAATDRGQEAGRRAARSDATRRGPEAGRHAMEDAGQTARAKAHHRSAHADRRRVSGPCRGDPSTAVAALATRHRRPGSCDARDHQDRRRDQVGVLVRRGPRDPRGPLCRAACPWASRPAAFPACPPCQSDLARARRGRDPGDQPCPTSTVRRQRCPSRVSSTVTPSAAS